MGLLGKIGHIFLSHVYMLLDLFGLLSKSIITSISLFSINKFIIFWQLFIRQLYNTGLKATYINTIIAVLIGILMMSLTFSILGENIRFIDYYAKLFVLVIIREIGPLISGVILIARSANAVTAEMGYLKQHEQLQVLKALRISPVYLLLLPVFYAFPLSLLLMFFYFDLVCIFSSWVLMSLLHTEIISLNNFLSIIMQQISLNEVIISASKALIGGLFIGLTCIYYGASVEPKFASISKSISSSTTSQLILLFLINILLSVIAYR
ncbi:ABC transporter permease [Pseudoalteromonas denitrificans]|uniref:Phospholipid/cholesterol/gamma-HCH transport system permease protein n=1 Tax=Pseudoalteromonas denitrificans DSM 6059 TaxID=1123010 RepID=A0A1I1FH46_9GAMM|nr:ABC transporter permease [Pseudoalteromonas denitrificans]SFB98727.1 phospholipid/cholesterol/gamma-HCH transport system permease protein [Pseudoalteromonas denitrificans DSM 6059]